VGAGEGRYKAAICPRVSRIRAANNEVNISAWLDGRSDARRFQIRLRVIHMKKMKATTNPAAISIQYWPSKPRKAKRLMRNCTVSVPTFGQNKRFVCAR
jgi:hypothetical protein